MKYNELKIRVSGDALEEAEGLLIEHGYTSMQIDDPLDALDIAKHRDLYKYDYINEEITRAAENAGTDSRKAVITLYFTDDEEGQRQLADATSLVSGLPGASYVTELTGDDSEWLYKWQEHFKPTRVGKRIVVKPGWEAYEPAEGDLVIEMDPGMAFGSGLHETTSMCVKALEKYMPRRAKVLDVGTGTGILAMAAVLLGADEAFGIDIDDEAVRVASENIEKNGLAGEIQIAKSDLMAGVEYEPDIIVANLMADLVMMLSPSAAEQIKAGGIYITSGILDIKVEQVSKAVRDAGFEIIEILSDGEWRAIIAVRKADK